MDWDIHLVWKIIILIFTNCSLTYDLMQKLFFPKLTYDLNAKLITLNMIWMQNLQIVQYNSISNATINWLVKGITEGKKFPTALTKKHHKPDSNSKKMIKHDTRKMCNSCNTKKIVNGKQPPKKSQTSFLKAMKKMLAQQNTTTISIKQVFTEEEKNMNTEQI